MKYRVNAKTNGGKNSEYQINEKVNESSHMVQILEILEPELYLY